MSPPNDTNPPKQARRHRPLLIGITLAIIAVLVFVLVSPLLGIDDSELNLPEATVPETNTPESATPDVPTPETTPPATE